MAKLFKIVIIVFIALISVTAFAEEVTFGTYIWKTNVPMKETGRSGKKYAAGQIVDSEARQRFKVLQFTSDNDSAIILILPYTKVVAGIPVPSDEIKFNKYNFKASITTFDSLHYRDKKSREYGSEQRYFVVPKSYISTYAVKYHGYQADLSVGVLTLPLKARLRDGDFTGNFTIGGSGGVKWRASQFKDRFHNVILGVGLSNITLDSNTVNKNKDNIVSNLSALTTSIGYVFQSGRAQAGLFFGVDFLTSSNQKRYNWIYQGKPWLSLGFGFAIFGEGKDDDNKVDQQD